MKTIGLLGGMSWESTVTYYQLINQAVGQRLGKLSSAQILLYSFNFEPIEQLQRQSRWDEAAALLAGAARQLERGGADGVVLCTNTMHRVAEQIAQAVSLPLIHIVDATAEAVCQQKIATVGLLGTRFTMEQAFYRDRLAARGLTVLVPDAAGRDRAHAIIYDELCLGLIQDSSRQDYRRMIQQLVDQGAEGIILGCTEIGLLVSAADSAVPLFDTTQIHAIAAVDWALG